MSAYFGPIQTTSLTIAGQTVTNLTQGSYSPVLSDGTFNFTMGVQKGYYWRTGGQVVGSIQVTWSSKGSATGVIRISLPFTSSTGTGGGFTRNGNSIGYISGIVAGSGSMLGLNHSVGTNYLVFQTYSGASGGTSLLSAASFATSGEAQLSFVINV